MQFDNEEANISWRTPPKKKYKRTNNKWQVPKFEVDSNSKQKRKLRSTRPKFDFPCTPTENLYHLISDDELSSPVLNRKKCKSSKQDSGKKKNDSDSDLELSNVINCNNEVLSPVLNTRVDKSPVLNEKNRYSDSESELNSSPVINRKNRLIKLRKIRLNKINETTSIQKLTKESSEIIDIDAKNIEIVNTDLMNNAAYNKHADSEIFKKITAKFNKNESIIQNKCTEKIEIETVETQNNINRFESTKNKQVKIFENLAKKFETDTEQMKIDLFDSQTLEYSVPANKTNENKQFIQNFVEEDVEIELINSQEEVATEIEVINSQESLQSPKSSENCLIESVESQKTSLVIISSNGTIVQDSLEKSSEEYQLSPLKKKKYKPNTLAYRFQKLLQKQKADVAIWKHELYLTSTTSYQIPATEEDYLITNLRICKMFADFGSNIWECEQNDGEKCLIIVDFNSLGNLTFKCGEKIQIIPPFYVKNILINYLNMKTFVNVHKILKL